MKYRKRSGIYVLLAGLMALTNSCNDKQKAVVRLLDHKTLKDFPSASAIEYADNRLYIFGDDAAYMLITDTSYNRMDTVLYDVDTTYRISKASKADIESTTLIISNNEKYLYALGSMSGKNRSRLFYFPLADIHTYLSIDYSPFAQKLTEVPELNIEGMALAGSKLILANRANNTNRINKLIVAGNNLYEYKTLPPPRVIDLRIDSQKLIGISGLYYVEEKDLLLFTASEEDTKSAVEDGTINDSYLGLISRFSIKLEDKTIQPDQLIKLASIDKVFEKQKIESVCLQYQKGDSLVLHLAADNDNGQSSFFKISVQLAR